MANLKASIKDIRKSAKRTLYNKRVKRKTKDALKRINDLINSKEIKAKDLLPRVSKLLDKAAKKNIIKKETAARKKSRIARRLLRISKSPQSPRQ